MSQVIGVPSSVKKKCVVLLVVVVVVVVTSGGLPSNYTLAAAGQGGKEVVKSFM